MPEATTELLVLQTLRKMLLSTTTLCVAPRAPEGRELRPRIVLQGGASQSSVEARPGQAPRDHVIGNRSPNPCNMMVGTP